MTFLNGVFKNVGGVAEIFGKLNLNLPFIPPGVRAWGVCGKSKEITRALGSALWAPTASSASSQQCDPGPDESSGAL